MNIIKYFLDSDRYKHFLISLVGSYASGIGFALGANLATEYKDKSYGDRWDWKDFSFGIAGGVIGEVLRILTIYLIWKQQ